MDVEGVLLGSSDYALRVTGLVPHCNASNLVLEILKHVLQKKLGGTICITVPRSKF